MLIQTEEKSVALTHLGTLTLNTRATTSRSASKSWIELFRQPLVKLAVGIRTN